MQAREKQQPEVAALRPPPILPLPPRLLLLPLLLLLLLKAQLTVQLKLSAVHIPSLVQRGSNFWLICQFRLEPGQSSEEQLYSVKWYRNNEEFYRLMLAPEPAGGWQQQPPEVAANNQQQQQQYFAQSGINVMMSSSNATHVRLLNASLESEGIYACEISTQNLSTIRYEKNIRVFVLPNSKLNIIGFKNRYSLNDKVELACQADFSRPQPALAWFINGRRIAGSNQWFELGAGNRSKLNELAGNLFAASLSLKFKLTSEFLGEYLSSSAANQRNQSQKKSSSSSVQPAHMSAYQLQQSPEFLSNAGQQQQPSESPAGGQLELRLQCKYKLAEVSEVTFNELALGGSARRKWAVGGRKPPGGTRRRRNVGARAPEVRLAKSSQSHQVMQSRAPASASSLWNFLQSHYYANIEQQCQLGALALLPDDPLLVSNGGVESEEESEEAAEVSIGELLSVDCSTLSGLLPARVAQQRSWRALRNNQCNSNQLAAAAADRQLSRRRLLQPISTPAGQQQYLNKNLMSPDSNYNNHNNGPANEESDEPSEAPNQRVPPPPPSPNRRQLLTGHPVARSPPPAGAYLWLERPITPRAGQDRRLAPDNATLTTTTTADSSTSDPLLAPPLLEWFINNQEAPANSVSGYSPDLPLLAPPPTEPANQSGGDKSRPHQAGFRSPASQQTPPARGLLEHDDDDQGEGDEGDHHEEGEGHNSGPLNKPPTGSSDALPSVDSTEYFANFDSRPIEQKLALSLKLDKKHFMTPDSTLRLKCTSTQAQVLLADAATLVILPVVIKPGQLQPELPGRWQQQRQAANKPKARASSRSQQKPNNGSNSVSLPSSLMISIPLAALSISFAIIFR